MFSNRTYSCGMFLFVRLVLICSHSDWIHVLTGFGCMCCWFRLIEYIKYFGLQYRGFIDAFESFRPVFLRIAVGALPIFIGFVMLCLTLFGNQSYQFRTFGYACQSLFAVTKGDNVYDTLLITGDQVPFVCLSSFGFH
jgi:hypothetical protein